MNIEMTKICSLWFLVGSNLIILQIREVFSFKVSYELDDRFIEYRKDAKWLVMFYAPWCHHCNKAEPIWEQVAQTFNQQESALGLRVGRIDATKQTRSASEFHVKGFPTIQFIHGDRMVTYEGERTREGIEEFAHKAIGPAVRKITALSELRTAEKKHEVFFISVVNGPDFEDPLRSGYADIAQEHMTSTYFFETDARLASGNVPFKEVPAVGVFKDGRYYMYDVKDTLKDWIINEKLSSFPKITGGNFYQLTELKKLIAIAVVELVPYRNTMDDKCKNIFDNLKSIAIENREKYHSEYRFGYLDGNEIINQVVSEWVQVPAFVVFDPVNDLYYFFNEPAESATVESLQTFLDGVLVGEVHGAGGKGWFRKAYKFFYSIAAYFYKMFSTQPILSSILFGLPLGILTIIIVMMYTNDCTDRGAEDDSDHEKED